MLIINLFGGPGSGKSTSAAALFALLKFQGVSVELVTEYAKDLTWEGRSLDNQVQILGKQFHRLWRIRKQVDIAVTDSPLLLSNVYNQSLTWLGPLVLELHGLFENVNFYLDRAKPYVKHGRHQTLEEAKKIDDRVYDVLVDNEIDFTVVPGNRQGIRLMMEEINKVLAANNDGA